MSAFDVVEKFEKEVADYCGSPFAVAVNSCTNALFLCLMWHRVNGRLPEKIEIPKRTYVSVPMQIIHAGAKVTFREEKWSGHYQLAPLPVWDAARRFTTNMYDSGHFMCTSHHWSKILGVQQGGMILLDSKEAMIWMKRARFDGRTEGVPPKKDKFTLGWHCYMPPEVAASGRVRLMHLPKNNPDLPMDDYPDLSNVNLFKS